MDSSVKINIRMLIRVGGLIAGLAHPFRMLLPFLPSLLLLISPLFLFHLATRSRRRFSGRDPLRLCITVRLVAITIFLLIIKSCMSQGRTGCAAVKRRAGQGTLRRRGGSDDAGIFAGRWYVTLRTPS